MVQSALVGQKPANQHDKDIIEGFWRFINRHYGPGGPPHPSIIPKKPVPGASDQSNVPRVYGVSFAMFFFILLITTARLLTRALKKQLKWGSDDWAIIPATILLLAYELVVVAGVKNSGFGKHIWEITYQNYQNYFMNLTIGSELFYAGMGILKISITLFNKRLAGLTSRKWQIYLNGLLVIYTLYVITAILTQAIMCVPVWILMRFDDLGTRNYMSKCLDSDQVSKALGLLHACFDFFLLPIPLIILRRTRMTTAQRMKLTLLFSMGLLSFIASIVRATLYIHRSASKDATCTCLNSFLSSLFFTLFCPPLRHSPPVQLSR